MGYNRDRDSAEQFVAELRKQTTSTRRVGLRAPRQCRLLPTDCRRTIGEVIDTHGRLDILVNNAGITIDKTVAAMTEDDWHGVLAVNLSGAFFLCQAALAHMVERGSGRIVNVSSVVGETGNIGQANYAASKSGLFGLTKTLAKEAAYQLAKSGNRADDGIGVTVNTVTPGLIEHRDDRRHPREGDGEADQPDPRRPRRQAGRSRTGGSLPCRRRFVLHHRPGVECQRWNGHVSRARIRVLDGRLRRYRDGRGW